MNPHSGYSADKIVYDELMYSDVDTFDCLGVAGLFLGIDANRAAQGGEHTVATCARTGRGSVKNIGLLNLQANPTDHERSVICQVGWTVTGPAASNFGSTSPT